MKINNVVLDEKINLGSQELKLNGAGVRQKYTIDIYIGALYTKDEYRVEDEVFQDKNPKRIVLHYLYEKIDGKLIQDGWVDGFRDNLSKEAYDACSVRLDQFNQCFTTMLSGDEVLIDYEPDEGTSVIKNGRQIGDTIRGEDFHVAVLKVLLGEKPAYKKLKKAMLGV
ncbi:MAG: hypothetical protein CL521_03450 [Actinobacteria bacterium]|nr:hypothetical protein [Actinomycetota bacterium]